MADLKLLNTIFYLDLLQTFESWDDIHWHKNDKSMGPPIHKKYIVLNLNSISTNYTTDVVWLWWLKHCHHKRKRLCALYASAITVLNCWEVLPKHYQNQVWTKRDEKSAIRQRGSHQHPRLETTGATSCQTSVHLSPTDGGIIGKAIQLLQAFCERDGWCTCSIMFLRVTTGHVTRFINNSEIIHLCVHTSALLHEHVRPHNSLKRNGLIPPCGHKSGTLDLGPSSHVDWSLDSNMPE